MRRTLFWPLFSAAGEEATSRAPLLNPQNPRPRVLTNPQDQNGGHLNCGDRSTTPAEQTRPIDPGQVPTN